MTNAGTNAWLCVASSADGHTLIAGQNPGNIEVSTNSGATWTTNATMTNAYWSSVGASADGTKLLAAAAFEGGDNINGLFLSTNSGATWNSNNLPQMYWGAVGMSGDGKILAATAPLNSSFESGGSVFCSTNSGTTWNSNGVSDACGVAMSADGLKIYVTGPEQSHYSTNFGASWMVMTSAPPSYAYISPSQYIATSSDGTRLILSVADSDAGPFSIYTSTNSGDSWNLTSLPENNWWGFVSSSADGKTLMATGNGLSAPSPLFISTNSGASWISNNVPNANWAGTACSADGGALVAVAASGIDSDPTHGVIYRSQSAGAPWLSAAASEGNLLLSWLIPSANFALEQSANLSDWSTATNTPAFDLTNLDEQIVVSPINGAGFYRLVH